MTRAAVVLRNQGKEGVHLHKVSSLARIVHELMPGLGVRVSSQFGAEDIRHHLRVTGITDFDVVAERLLPRDQHRLVVVFDLPAGRPLNWDDASLAEEFVAQMEDLAGLAATSRLWMHLSDAHRYLPWRVGLRRSDRSVLGRRPVVVSTPSRAYLRARSAFWRAVRSASLLLVETAAQLRWMQSMSLPVALFPGRLTDEPEPEVVADEGSRHPVVERVRRLAADGTTLVGVTGRALKGKKGTLGALEDALQGSPDLRFVLLGAEPVPVRGPDGAVVFAGTARLGEADYLEVMRSCTVLLNVPGPEHPLLHGTGSISDAIAVRRPLITAPHLIDDGLLGFASSAGWDAGPLDADAISASVARGRAFDWSLWGARAVAARLIASEEPRADARPA